MNNKGNTIVTSSGGITLGAIAAGLCSWSVNSSIGWAIIHALCGWFYVIYWAICK